MIPALATAWLRVGVLAMVSAAPLGCCSKGKDVQVPASVPVYPGAARQTAGQSDGLVQVSYRTTDDGFRVKAWYQVYPAQQGWRPVSGAEWTKTSEQHGMRFEEQAFQTATGTAFLKVQLAYRYDEPNNCNIQLVHCEPRRKSECATAR